MINLSEDGAIEKLKKAIVDTIIKKSPIFLICGAYMFILLIIIVSSFYIFLEFSKSTVSYSISNSTEIILNKTVNSKLINTTTTISSSSMIEYPLLFYLGVLTLTSIFFWKLLDTIKNYGED